MFIYSLSGNDGKVRYIGKTNNIKRRLIGHISESKTGSTHKCKWLRKILSEKQIPNINIIGIYPENIIDGMEMFWIDYFLRLGCNLTNLTKGGEGHNMTTLTKTKISKALKGKPKSESHKDKVSESLLGNSRRATSCSCVDPETGIIIKVYDKIKDVELDGFNRRSVGNVLTGYSKKAHGYKWIYNKK